MPESAIAGLVEGLLQGQALKHQRQQEAYDKERQHATDIFNQHVQTWKETQAAQQSQSLAEQQKFDNKLATDQQSVREAEEKRKTAADEDRRKLAEAASNAKTEAQKASLYFKAIGSGLGYTPEQATMLTGYTPPASGASASPVQIGGGASSALDILKSAGQNAPPIPGSSANPSLTPPAIQSLMSTPPGTLMPPGMTGPRATAMPTGQAPKVAADIAAKNARAGVDAARIPLLTTENAEHIQNIAYRKQMTDNAAHNQKLIDAKVGLTHAQESYRKAMLEIDATLKNAQSNIAAARAADEIARTEYVGIQGQHIKMMDALRTAGKDISDYKKRGDILQQARTAESKQTNDRYKQEDALSKVEATYNSYKDIAAQDPNTFEKPEDKVRVQIAKDNMKVLEQKMSDAKARIAEIKARETESHSYVVKSTQFVNQSGAPNKGATTKEHSAADDLAADAAKAAKEADKAATEAGLTIPGIGTLTDPKKHLPNAAKKLPVPLAKIKDPKKHPATSPKIIRFDAQGNQLP